MNEAKVFAMSFASIYPMYVSKAARKGRSQQEVDEIILWLTGYTEDTLRQQIASEVNLDAFFAQAPQINPNATLIKGSICGYRVEEIADTRMRNIRYLDKLIDELAKGRPMEKILRK